MRDEDIIRMANQTASFFEPYPKEEAVAGVADHFMKFWEPHMRKDLIALLKKKDDRLAPLVLEAASKISA